MTPKPARNERRRDLVAALEVMRRLASDPAPTTINATDPAAPPVTFLGDVRRGLYEAAAAALESELREMERRSDADPAH